MNKLLAFGIISIFLVEELRLSNQIDQTSDAIKETERALNIAEQYEQKYLEANTKVKRADSLLNSGMIINLSNLK